MTASTIAQISSIPVCAHANTILTRMTTSNGTIQVRKQCMRCGATVGNAIRHGDITTPITQLPPFNDELRDEWSKRIIDARQSAAEMRRQIIDAESQGRRDWYRNVYLLSDAWKEKRLAVLKRDRYICQGCLSEKATDVHHLTYEHIGNELLWELISVCRDCHNRAHGVTDDADTE